MRSAESKRLDMLHGPIWSKLPQFALPVAATAILEQLFNASDIAVVGNFTGADKTIAVAAVGANSALIALIVVFPILYTFFISSSFSFTRSTTIGCKNSLISPLNSAISFTILELR